MHEVFWNQWHVNHITSFIDRTGHNSLPFSKTNLTVRALVHASINKGKKKTSPDFQNIV